MEEVIKGTVDRNLYYYDIVVYTKREDGKSIANQDGYLRRALMKLYQRNQEVKECNNSDEQKNKLKKLLLPVSNGDKIYAIVDKIEEEGPVELRVVLSRDDAFPFIEKNGELINMTSEVEGDFNVAEVTHCVIFPEEFVMGAEYNFNGARPSAIAKYIPIISSEIISMECHGKLKNDVFERIIEDKGYSLFEIGVKNTLEMRQALRDNMAFVCSFINDIDNVDSYEVSIKRRITKKKKGFLPPVTPLQLKEFVEHNRENITHFKISQGVFKDSIDLLSDKLVSTRSFVLTNNKVIDSSEVYKAIEVFYDEVVSRN